MVRAFRGECFKIFFFSFRFIQYARVVKAAVNVAPH